MNPYLTLPVVLPGDPTNNIPEFESKGKFLPAQFIGYTEGPDNTLFIYLQGGQVIYCKITMKDLEEAMRQYWLAIAKHQQKNNNIVVLPGSKHN